MPNSILDTGDTTVDKKSRLPLQSLHLKGEEAQSTSELRKLLQVIVSERKAGGGPPLERLVREDLSRE